MRDVDITEVLIFILAGLTGFFMGVIRRWWSILIGIIGLSLCSYLTGHLKKQVLKEYIDKLNKDKELK